MVMCKSLLLANSDTLAIPLLSIEYLDLSSHTTTILETLRLFDIVPSCMISYKNDPYLESSVYTNFVVTGPPMPQD